MSKVRAWLQLFRVPNLLTVPGDPLAGFLLVSGGRLDARVVPAVFACLCLYTAGLVINDLADQKEDTVDRPNRPLPSGAVKRGAAMIVAGNLVIFGLGFCAMLSLNVAIMGLGVLLGVLLYNLQTKNIPIIGALNMGVCRGGSVLVGAAAAMPDFPILSTGIAMEPFAGALAFPIYSFAGLISQQRFMIFGCGAAFVILLYIAAVTNLARHETRSEVPRFSRLLPLASVFIGFVILKIAGTGGLLLDAAPTLWVLGIFMAAGITAQLMREPMPPLPPRIGSFIRLLPILQASLCVVPPVGLITKSPASLGCALALLACVPLHAWLAKKFYAS